MTIKDLHNVLDTGVIEIERACGGYYEPLRRSDNFTENDWTKEIKLLYVYADYSYCEWDGDEPLTVFAVHTK